MTDIPAALTAITAAQAQLVIATNALTAAPPVPVPLPATGWYISDAPGCTNGNFFHMTAAAAWENSGGDWWDATGAKQGATPYATVSSPFGGLLPQSWSFDITKLVADAIAAGLPIELIMTGTGRYIDALGSADPPVVNVVYGDGTTAVLPCVVCMALDASTVQPVNQTPLPVGAGAGGGAALRFGTLASGKTVTSALLNVTSPQQWGGAAAVMKIFRLRQPIVPSTVEYGIAKAGQLSTAIFNMTLDDGAPLSKWLLEPTTLDYTSAASYDLVSYKNPALYPAVSTAVGKFTGDNFKTHSLTTLESGKKAIKFVCVGPTEMSGNPGYAGPGQETVTDWVFHFPVDANGHLPVEMYVQWKMMLDPDFVIPEGSTLGGGKWGLGFSHRTTTCGNGGAFCHAPPADAGKMGWTSRGDFRLPSDKRDPAFGKMLYGTYDYNAVESQMNHEGGLLACFMPGVEYTIEKAVHMNTHDMSGATPALSDGWTRIWVNGVRVLDRGGYKFRDNPPWVTVSGTTSPLVPVIADAGILSVWWNGFYGGTEFAPMHNTHYIRDVRIAASYIGPDA